MKKKTKIHLRPIIRSINPHKPEVAEIARVGCAIAKEMWKIRWLQWTQFPSIFKDCRSDAELCEAIDNFNGWLTETGLGRIMGDVDPKLLTPDTERPENYNPRHKPLKDKEMRSLDHQSESGTPTNQAGKSDTKVADPDDDVSANRVMDLDDLDLLDPNELFSDHNKSDTPPPTRKTKNNKPDGDK